MLAPVIGAVIILTALYERAGYLGGGHLDLPVLVVFAEEIANGPAAEIAGLSGPARVSIPMRVLRWCRFASPGCGDGDHDDAGSHERDAADGPQEGKRSLARFF
ncbi:hypothetical protein [Mycobacteroides abscessus]|uniref:hypothetical protein n=1 Tax=Mycobacteroides abscessus TaxID=36809 RepID=UPI00025879E7|nr:hypothetical protein [Mycobacteroides abscessus]EIC67505.1 hypothetical protein OUW_07223 [Mycobacteroides abscessus M93]